ncbi:4-hydroxy-tetrahydrodipicolinate synthase (EC 4.3.3.7) [uncultured Gammaproteobacteria bacterium]|jgi:4-hydroxy-tetrahydrodipicolinate synthase|uniref:4-hydroxy-tetrahydrodipicolinate synthase n=1 Tax=thiotrophic endosymbiont of Bathymodiolus puteoserpentis (Logatchev) TaxID=343240 RepID=UPI0010B02825|nr:4-hydroxy-tetrahydrodipicolinate synthase [thiotrophic endosymbiont of Bathymodiolus puteoserpentis (Logatchev)]CAC9570192.1 4-hydroxy-tetrahydrodipicolinate synthase (EC 4.3.3.7) [uncultured Gammaproteobacteria bacterium]CAC9571752.1 4-hydroxy-tetrahydrodipicolinate synthase (EC 4.3.3.7) [uncultured Gammaproteobacteria bacterium]CAC9577889.1 4-hydroxy-tetrahydrodipicolinate synthase (EC 4.3.3.7) [uncultured Gammaproteobacteria bacterium]CAC9625980.1 4-hydroxy-tetrahydrodipicolinate synthase
MRIEHPLTGAMVALITPMLEDGSVDFDALANLVEFHIKSGTKAIISMGTTGESATLNQDEHIEVMQKTIEFAKGRIAIIAGTGANSTSEAIELTQAAKALGANAALLVTPYYNKPTQEGLYQHYKAIAEAVDIDQILYNVPGRTAVDLLPETAIRLSAISNIIGIKDATGQLSVAQELIDGCPENFLLYSGDDATAVEFILMGGHGGISVSANVAPAEVSNAYQAAFNKDRKLAETIDANLYNLHQHLFTESNPIPVKWAMYKMGKCDSGIRLPLTKLSPQYQMVLEQDLSNLGVI